MLQGGPATVRRSTYIFSDQLDELFAHHPFQIDGNLASVRILSTIGGKCVVRWKDQAVELDTSPGSDYDLHVENGNLKMK